MISYDTVLCISAAWICKNEVQQCPVENKIVSMPLRALGLLRREKHGGRALLLEGYVHFYVATGFCLIYGSNDVIRHELHHRPL
jgi:hypothetical protein